MTEGPEFSPFLRFFWHKMILVEWAGTQFPESLVLVTSVRPIFWAHCGAVRHVSLSMEFSARTLEWAAVLLSWGSSALRVTVSLYRSSFVT